MPREPQTVRVRLGGALPPGVHRTPQPIEDLAADPEYQDGLRRGDAARQRRAEMAKASVRRRKEEGSGLTKPVPVPKSGGAAKGRPASRGPGGWRGPKKDWKCSQYDPLPLFLIYFPVVSYLFRCLFFTIPVLLTLLR